MRCLGIGKSVGYMPIGGMTGDPASWLGCIGVLTRRDLVDCTETAIGRRIRVPVCLGRDANHRRGPLGHILKVSEHPEYGPSQVVNLRIGSGQDPLVVRLASVNMAAGVPACGRKIPGEKIEPLGESVESGFVDLKAVWWRHTIPRNRT
jgi:hypothetical protein